MNATLVLVAAAGLVVAADASTKAAALRLPAAGVGHRSFGLRLVLNRRAGLPGVTTPTALAILIVLAIALAGLAVAADVDTMTASALGLALGGALGNLVDRLRRGAVVDFVVVGRWPVFNVADVALVVGAVIAAASVIA